MYLPRFVPLSSPYMATWHGRSGKAYEFGVVDRGYSLRDAPAVVLLVEHQPDGTSVPLWVGRNSCDPIAGCSFAPPAGEWQNRTRGRLMLHVRFEALWESAQQAEIDDLIAALDPPLNAVVAASPAPLATVALDVPAIDVLAPAADAPLTTADVALAATEVSVDQAADTAAPSLPVPPEPLVTLPVLVTTEEPFIPEPPFAAEPPEVAVPRAAARSTPFARLRATIKWMLGGLRRRQPVDTANNDERTAPPQAAEPAPMPADTESTVSLMPFNPAIAEEARPVALAEAAVVPPPVSSPTPSPAPPPGTPTMRVVSREPAASMDAAAACEVPVASDRPVTVLFAGEMAQAAGVDILVEAAAIVAADPTEARFLFVGDGPLKMEMMARTNSAGFAPRCRFLGHLDSDAFAAVLNDSDILVVPGRVAQDHNVARSALAAGRWVLTTHQASIDGVEHGRNGLVTYDNPGSLVWGLRDLMGRIVQHRQNAGRRAA